MFQQNDSEQLPIKLPRLLEKYSRIRSGKNLQETTKKNNFYGTLSLLVLSVLFIGMNRHWHKMCHAFPTFSQIAKRILCIPASLAQIERVFSQGGIFMRPHRSSLSSDMLKMLLYLKRNEDIL